jgi:hypothetical protein
VSGPVPEAVTLNVAVSPGHFVAAAGVGPVLIEGAVFTVSVAAFDVALPQVFVATQV